jgi:hypothetical protein
MSVNIIGKDFFQSKNSINRLKNDIKSGVDVVKEYSKYLKEGYMFIVSKSSDTNDIKFEVVNIEENDKKVRNKRFFELKIKELKEKRLSDSSQKNIFEKAKTKYNIDDEIVKLYYDLKKYVDRPVLNPMDAHSNKEQYIPIIEELCQVFKGNNIYNKYYTMLLSSLKV